MAYIATLQDLLGHVEARVVQFGPSHASAWLGRLGFPYLGKGLSRTVNALDDSRVLKIALEGGKICNKREAAFSKAYPQLPLAHVLDCADNGLWLIAQRARARSDLTAEVIGNIARSFSRGVPLGEDTEDKIYIDDIHGNNVGLIGDTPVIIDYGFEVVPQPKETMP